MITDNRQFMTTFSSYANLVLAERKLERETETSAGLTTAACISKKLYSSRMRTDCGSGGAGRVTSFMG